MRAVVWMLLMLWASPAPALQPEAQLPDPQQEARAMALAREVRCVVCAGQSIADSNATVAQDMLAFVRQEVSAGASTPEIREALALRYGESVLLNPRFSVLTAALWLLPAVMLIAGVVLLLLRQRRVAGRADEALSPEEQAALDRLMATTTDGIDRRRAEPR